MSTLVMFGLMYLNPYEVDHVRYSETRTYMALVMGAAMAIVVLAFMRGMYPRRRVNLAIFALQARQRERADGATRPVARSRRRATLPTDVPRAAAAERRCCPPPRGWSR
jgi:hypothetical protein